MSISKRIETYILKRNSTTLSELEGVVVSSGFTLDDLYQALESIHRNKRITRKVLGGEVTYLETPKPKTPGDHLRWWREHYPPMDETNDGSGIDVGDLSWMFLKTKEERDAFIAEMKGKPAYMIKSRHGNPRK